MALGAVYPSQLAFRGVRCCLRRLNAVPPCQAERDVDRHRGFQELTTERGTTVTVPHDAAQSSMTTPSSMSLNINIRSGSEHRDENPPAASSSSSTPAAELRARALQPPAPSSTSTASGLATSAAAVREDRDHESPKEISNPWNQFQHEFRGKGFSKATMAKMYKLYKDKGTKMP